eukprot:GHVT01017487.1.p2 GENE.GHVT01017487.1~~GHVT01017487.1.p2  ORF type:complete len:103 (+),score=3.73 GHVT01017487.1:604-912(+)
MAILFAVKANETYSIIFCKCPHATTHVDVVLSDTVHDLLTDVRFQCLFIVGRLGKSRHLEKGRSYNNTNLVAEAGLIKQPFPLSSSGVYRQLPLQGANALRL